MEWKNKNVLVTGGASFISSHIVDKLVELGANVRVVDDLSSGKIENIKGHIDSGRIEFIKGDLREVEVAKKTVSGMNVMFHLAADHGGRGYVTLHQVACSTNMILDSIVFREANNAGVEKVVFASSGCIYPNFLQTNPNEILYLKEEMAGPPYDSDNMYGWAKLMAEKTLRAYYKESGMKSASCRYFTVYGPRGVENHAVIAMIARALIEQNPFQIWGTGEQVRNWTYVDDIVRGSILSAEKIDDSSAVNLGTMERIRVIDAAREILRYTKKEHITIQTQPNMPTGPLNRVADNSLAKKILGWEPQVKFIDGLHKTIDWYFSTKKPEQVKIILERMLTER